MKVKMLQGENWYGACAEVGVTLPFNLKTKYSVNLQPNQTANQASPLVLSSHGRYVWGEDGFLLQVENGELNFSSKGAEPVLYQGGRTLKEAYLEASSRFFPPQEKIPPEVFFRSPQYNTWIELMYNQNEADVLRYATSIKENGFPTGVLMIDDGWSEYYGGWRFHAGKFPNGKQMVEQLHKGGFYVMLWLCPFISLDSSEFRYLQKKDCLVKNSENKTKIVEWWNGYSAVLDLSNPIAWDWLKDVCDTLMSDHGIDGFKFDAGDACFYSDQDFTYGKVSANEQASLWNKFGLGYPFNEYRACYKNANQPLVQRLADKSHCWDKNGLSSLVPNILAQGILGYSYTCPDMIGGGNFIDFLPDAISFDSELMLRYCAASALMPMMQFSAAPWRLLNEQDFMLCQKLVELHQGFADYILELAEHSSKTGEPIIRYLEYEFPHEGLEAITDQFMLGSKILVAPHTSKGTNSRIVILPQGEWESCDGIIYSGGHVEITVLPGELPYFMKIS